jgi:hypothetical protein
MATPSLLLIPDRYKSGVLYSQLPESGAGDLTFTRASAATRVNASGLIESVASGVPRLDYTGGGCPSLLLEPQRTNLVTYSEEFDDASWAKGGVTISANTNATLDPSGQNFADKLVEDSSNGNHRVFNNSSVTISDSDATTYSVFAKAAERTQIYLRDNDIVGARFNLSTGEVISTEGTATATITNYGNGWYRCTITRVSSTTAGRVIVYLDNGGDSYTGDNTSGVFIWGAQVEAGAYPTSYIPTTSAAVTRAADAALTASVPSLIGQNEGTLFVEMKRESLAESFIVILSALAGTTVNSYQNSLYLFQVSNGVFASDCFVSDVNQFAVELSEGLSVGRHKIAVAYKQNDFTLYIDGVQIGTDTSGNVPAMNFLTIGGVADVPNHKNIISQTAIYPVRLSNSELAALTAL